MISIALGPLSYQVSLSKGGALINLQSTESINWEKLENKGGQILKDIPV